MLLPRLLLRKGPRGGQAGNRNLQNIVQWFDTGRWDLLIRGARASTGRNAFSAGIASDEILLQRKMMRAVLLAEQGELSHAARELKSSGMAVGSPATFDELSE